jgi:hypothetical protein
LTGSDSSSSKGVPIVFPYCPVSEYSEQSFSSRFHDAPLFPQSEVPEKSTTVAQEKRWTSMVPVLFGAVQSALDQSAFFYRAGSVDMAALYTDLAILRSTYLHHILLKQSRSVRLVSPDDTIRSGDFNP